MADQILLNVRVDAGRATGDIKKFSATTKSEMASVERTTTSSLGAVSQSSKSVGQSFAGAGASISAANGALMLMGRQGPPALQTIAAGAASVAVSGFGPLSLAIVGVTTALSFFLSQTEDAPPEIDAVTASLDRQTETLKRLGSAADAASLRLRAVSEGRTVGAQRNEEELRQAQYRLSQIDTAIERRNARLRELEGGGSGLAPGIALLEIEQIERSLGRLNKDRNVELEIVRRISDIRSDTLETEKKIAEQSRKGVGASSATLADFARTLGAPGGPKFTTSGVSGLGMPGMPSVDEFIARVRSESGIRSAAEIRAAAQNAALGGPRNLTTDDLVNEFGMLGGDGVDRTPRLSQLEADSQSRASSLTSNIASGLNQALQSEDYTNVGRNIAGSIVTALNQAVLEGALEGLGVKDAVSSGFSAIGSAFSGGGDAPVEATG